MNVIVISIRDHITCSFQQTEYVLFQAVREILRQHTTESAVNMEPLDTIPQLSSSCTETEPITESTEQQTDFSQEATVEQEEYLAPVLCDIVNTPLKLTKVR